MDYVNKNSHVAVVKNNDGALQTLAPGEVVNADGGFADRLAACPGVEEANRNDKKAWSERNDTAAAEVVDPTPASQVNSALVKARQLAQEVLVATNQIVIGDDQAPYGPPSGVVTSVDAVKDPEHFGHLSAAHLSKVGDGETAADLIGGVEQANSAAIHNSQVEAHDNVSKLSAALAGLHGSDVEVEDEDVDGDDSDELPEGLPDNYDDLNASDAELAVNELEGDQREAALAYERGHKDRAFASAE